jgi:hypothetical protein
MRPFVTSPRVEQVKTLLESMVPEELVEVLDFIKNNDLVRKSEGKIVYTESIYTVDIVILFTHWGAKKWSRTYSFRTVGERDEFQRQAVEMISKFTKYRNISEGASIVSRTLGPVTPEFLDSMCNMNDPLPKCFQPVFDIIKGKLTEEEIYAINASLAER